MTKLESEISSGLTALRELLSRYSTHSVAGMCFSTAFAEPSRSEEKLMSPAKQIAFLLGVLLESPEPPNAKDFRRREWVRSVEILNRLFLSYMSLYMPAEGSKGQPPGWLKTREVAMAAFLHHYNTGMLASVEQIRKRVLTYVLPFDEYITRSFGISAKVCVDICDYIRGTLQKNLDAVSEGVYTLSGLQTQPFDAFESAVRQSPSRAFPNSRLDVENLCSNLERLGIVSFDELTYNFPENGETFWRRFAISRGEGPGVRYPTERSIFELRPLLKISRNEAFCPNINTLWGSVLLQCEDELLAQFEVRSRFLRARDKSLELEALAHFKRIVGKSAKIWTNVFETNDCQHEHDIVIADDELCLVIEAKASPPTEPFRDPDKAFVRLQRAFHADTGIQKAFEQSNRIVTRILDGTRIPLYDSKGSPVGVLEPNPRRLPLAVCVTRDNFGLIATNLALLLKKQEHERFPWVVNVLDLESFAEGWEYLKWGSKELREYLQQRTELHGTILADDELDYAGCFIRHGGFDHFPKGEKVLVQLEPSYSGIFDEIYRHLHQGGPPPTIERASPPVITDLRESLRVGEPVFVQPRRKKVGRNDQCPCRSGKKFKKCCGR